MTMRKPGKFLQVPDTIDLKQFIKSARIVWRQAHPESKKKLGRRSEDEENLTAIKAIATGHAGVSMGELRLWTQADWISAISHYEGEHSLGKATLKKSLEKALKIGQFPFPVHQIPASLIRKQSVQEQLEHWYTVALFSVILSGTNPDSDKTTISYTALNDAHRSLCSKHMQKRDRPTEERRQQWCLSLFQKTCLGSTPTKAP